MCVCVYVAGDSIYDVASPARTKPHSAWRGFVGDRVLRTPMALCTLIRIRRGSERTRKYCRLAPPVSQSVILIGPLIKTNAWHLLPSNPKHAICYQLVHLHFGFPPSSQRKGKEGELITTPNNTFYQSPTLGRLWSTLIFIALGSMVLIFLTQQSWVLWCSANIPTLKCCLTSHQTMSRELNNLLEPFTTPYSAPCCTRWRCVRCQQP